MRLTRRCKEKEHLSQTSGKSKKSKKAELGAVVVFQHVLFWSALYVTASSAYMTYIGAVTSDLLPSTSLLIASGGISLIHLGLYNAAAYVSARPQTFNRTRVGAILQTLATLSVRVAVTVWLGACGLAITFTVAREPYCLPQDRNMTLGAVAINSGSTCIIQRTGIWASLLALLAAGALFVLIQKASDPYRAHLFGVTREPALLPLSLASKNPTIFPMFSEMSFKCRSSSSLSSHTLVQSHNASSTHLLPTRPDKAALGLGIYTPKHSAPSFLTPRPSLCSIRTHTTMGSLPPNSPLPPMPACFPEKYRKQSAMQKAVYPPRGPYILSRTQSQKTVRIVPPSPALSTANLKAFNKSTESLSSVYSCSTSGEKHTPRPGASSEGSRSCSSSSIATVVKSPLGAMRLADDPETIVMSRNSSDGSDSDIDDAVTLQAKLPSVQAVSEFEDVVAWQVKRPAGLSYCPRPTCKDQDGEMRRLEFTPLSVRRTRGGAARFSTQR